MKSLIAAPLCVLSLMQAAAADDALQRSRADWQAMARADLDAVHESNRLVMPLKVWRNRLRGDSVPWVPDEPIAGSLDDDNAVKDSVDAILARRFGIRVIR